MDERPVNATAQSSQQHRKRIGLLLAVHAAAALVTMAVMAGPPPGEFLETLFVSAALSQGSLLGIWAALGGRATPWRLVGAVVGLVAWMRTLDATFPDSDVQLWAWILLSQTIATSLPLLASRFWGVAVARWSANDAISQRHRLQFSIRALLEWTAALAVMLGTFQMTSEGFRRWLADENVILMLLRIIGPNALIALAALWITLGTRWTLARILALGLTAAAVVPILMTVPFFWTLLSFIVLSLLCSFWLIGSLWVFRAAGYRLVWRGRIRL
jgi:hypothetical protein